MTWGKRSGAGGIVVPLALVVLVISATLGSAATGVKTRRVSLSSAEQEGDGASRSASVSGDGRFVAFASEATNLVNGDTNGQQDIFVRDRKHGTTTRVSVSSSGRQANDSSFAASISPNGRFVAFISFATNLVRRDTNGVADVFVHDLATGRTIRASVSSSGRQANGATSYVAISGGGRFVAFESSASNLVRGDENGVDDAFVHDLTTGGTTRVSVRSNGREGNGASGYPGISANGRFVAFWSEATNLVRGDTNGYGDDFVHDLKTGRTVRVSVSSAGKQGDADVTADQPRLSADGRFVAFASYAENLVRGDDNGVADVFVHDLASGRTRRVSVGSTGVQADASCFVPSISADGRYVAFISDATTLATDATPFGDVFVHDRATGRTRLASLNTAGDQANNHASDPWLSADGRFVVFHSLATNLAGVDANAADDVFIRGPLR